MEIPYSFLQRSANNQFKDMAFFQILKRKGPYIERSLTKIQNDLFYRHKLPGNQMKNLAFIKQIRLTLSAYEILVNEIRNDFMMTELDTLGDGIHKMFSQLISIVNFFVAVVLKKQKLQVDELRQMSVEEKRQKEIAMKKVQEQYRAKQLQQAQKDKNDRFKQIQQLKYNFKELFKLQVDSDKQKQGMQKVWTSIVNETIEKAKQSTLIKDSQLQKIIKDSCEYLYKNHSQLDHIVRLTKQDIIQAEKNIETFGDQRQLMEENEQRITQMKQVARKLVSYVRDKVYNHTQVMVQTDLTQGDGSRGMMTTKQLDDKRRVQIKMRAYQRQLRQKDEQIGQIQLKLKQAELRLKKAQQITSESEQQQSSQQRQKFSKRSQQLKRKSFINGRRNNQSGNNLLAQKFSANLLRNNNNISKSRKARYEQRSQDKYQNNNSNLQQNNFKLNPKVSVRGSNHSDLRKGTIIISTVNRNSKRKTETISIVNKKINKNNNNNSPHKSYAQNNQLRQNEHHAISQHEVLPAGKNDGRFSSSTFKDYSNKKITSKKITNNNVDDKNSAGSSMIINDNKSSNKKKRNSINILGDGQSNDQKKKQDRNEHKQQSQEFSNRLQQQNQLSQQQQKSQQPFINPTASTNKKFYKVRNSYQLQNQSRLFQSKSRVYIKSKQNMGDDDDDNNSDDDKDLSRGNIYSHKKSNKEQNQQLASKKDNNQRQQQRQQKRVSLLMAKNKQKIMENNQGTQKDQQKNKLTKNTQTKLLSNKQGQYLQNNQLKSKPSNKNTTPNLTLNHTIKLTIRPSFIKRYIQSTYNHPLTQQKHLIQPNQTNNGQSFYQRSLQQTRFFTKIQKLNKSASQSQLPTKCFFQSLGMDNDKINEFGDNRKVANNRRQLLRQQNKMKYLLGNQRNNNKNKEMKSSFSVDVKCKNNKLQNINKENIIKIDNNCLSQYQQTHHQLQKQNQIFTKSCILKKPIDLQQQQGGNKNFQKSNLKKSSLMGRNVSFVMVSVTGQGRKGVNGQKD